MVVVGLAASVPAPFHHRLSLSTKSSPAPAPDVQDRSRLQAEQLHSLESELGAAHSFAGMLPPASYSSVPPTDAATLTDPWVAAHHATPAGSVPPSRSSAGEPPATLIRA